MAEAQKDALTLIKEGKVELKHVAPPADRKLPTAEEIAAAKKLAEEEPQQPAPEDLPKSKDGKTHLEIIKEGKVELKPVAAPERKLPTAEEIAAAKKLAEEEPQQPAPEDLPKAPDGKTHLDLIKQGGAELKHVAPPERKLPTAEEIAAAKKLAEEEPQQPAPEDLPKAPDGKTHLDLIKQGGAELKHVAPPERKLPTAEEIAAAKKLAEEEPQQPAPEDLPKAPDGKTHLDLIKQGGAELKHVEAPKERPLPTAEQIAEEKKHT